MHQNSCFALVDSHYCLRFWLHHFVRLVWVRTPRCFGKCQGSETEPTGADFRDIRTAAHNTAAAFFCGPVSGMPRRKLLWLFWPPTAVEADPPHLRHAGWRCGSAADRGARQAGKQAWAPKTPKHQFWFTILPRIWGGRKGKRQVLAPPRAVRWTECPHRPTLRPLCSCMGDTDPWGQAQQMSQGSQQERALVVRLCAVGPLGCGADADCVGAAAQRRSCRGVRNGCPKRLASSQGESGHRCGIFVAVSRAPVVTFRSATPRPHSASIATSLGVWRGRNDYGGHQTIS